MTSPRNICQPFTDLTPSLGDVAKGPTTETAALTPVPVSYSSALVPGPGSDSLARASCTTGTTRPGQAARPQVSPVPSKMGSLMGGQTRGTCWIPARFGCQTPDLIISGLVPPGSSLAEELGVGSGRRGGRDPSIKMEKGMKTKPLLTNKELKKGQRSLAGLIKV